MEDIQSFMTDLARRAGQLLATRYHSNNNVRFKSDRSLVTDADFEADRLITQAIQKHFLSEMILSEELNPQLENQTGAALWVIDPLDGTTNFALGLPFWGVSIARLTAGYPEAGVIYFPLLDELYFAREAHGAFLNGNPLKVQPPDPNKPWSFFSCCSRTYRDYNISLKYKPRILGSATYSICSVASGIALISFDATPKIWDIAAAWLVVKEAGGAVQTHDGSQPFPVKPGLDYSRQIFPTLAAATPDLLRKAQNQIVKK